MKISTLDTTSDSVRVAAYRATTLVSPEHVRQFAKEKNSESSATNFNGISAKSLIKQDWELKQMILLNKNRKYTKKPMQVAITERNTDIPVTFTSEFQTTPPPQKPQPKQQQLRNDF
jgi:hypothetical protein